VNGCQRLRFWTMRGTIALTIAFLALALPCAPQEHKIRVFLASDDVSSAEVGKSLDKHCPQVTLTIDQQRADYLLEAKNTGEGPARKPYKFTLFDRTSDRVFSTETARMDNAVKDVCAYLRRTP
jgi:hypothetical protein